MESSAVAGGNDTFFIGSSDARKLSKFDAVTGKEIWSHSTTGWSWGTPTAVNGRVYLGSTGSADYPQPLAGGFVALDVDSGTRLWGYTPAATGGYVSGGVHSAPAVAKGMVFVGDLDGHLRVFEQ